MKSINNTNRTYVTRNFSNFDAEENISSLDEGAFDFLVGKSKLYLDVEQSAQDAGTTFDTYMDSPNYQKSAKDAKTKTEKVLGELKAKKAKEHERSDYRDFLDRIQKAVSEFTKTRDGILAKNKKYADVSKIIEEASEMSKAAAEKANAANMEISKKKSEKDTKLKDAIKLSKTLKKDETKGKNEEIHDIQKEFIRKFKNNSKIKDSEIFKKIKDAVEVKKEGGFFGPTTEKIIKGLKAGFGMDDKTSDITKELIDKIYTEKIEESNRDIKGFSNFDLMNEDFDAAKFLEVVGEKGKEGKKNKVDAEKIAEEEQEKGNKIYNNNKISIDYITSKDFKPLQKGKDIFSKIFGISWDNFDKYGVEDKNSILIPGFNYVIIPKIGENPSKEDIDNFFKG